MFKIDTKTFRIERDGKTEFQIKISDLDGTEDRALRGYATEAAAQAALLRHIQRVLNVMPARQPG